MNWGISLVNTLKHYDVNSVFGFHYYQYILWGQSKLMILLLIHYLIQV